MYSRPPVPKLPHVLLINGIHIAYCVSLAVFIMLSFLVLFRFYALWCAFAFFR